MLFVLSRSIAEFYQKRRLIKRYDRFKTILNTLNQKNSYRYILGPLAGFITVEARAKTYADMSESAYKDLILRFQGRSFTIKEKALPMIERTVRRSGHSEGGDGARKVADGVGRGRKRLKIEKNGKKLTVEDNYGMDLPTPYTPDLRTTVPSSSKKSRNGVGLGGFRRRKFDFLEKSNLADFGGFDDSVDDSRCVLRVSYVGSIPEPLEEVHMPEVEVNLDDLVLREIKGENEVNEGSEAEVEVKKKGEGSGDGGNEGEKENQLKKSEIGPEEP